MTEPSSLPASQPIDNEADEISLMDLLIVLAKHKLLIFGMPFLVASLAAGYSLTLPNIFTASTKILTPSQSGTSALSQLGGLAALAGMKNPSDIYMGMLKSRTVADNMIQRFDLMQLYAAQNASQARGRLAGVTNIVAGKDGIIAIEVDDKEPKRAAEMANAYVGELFKLTNVLALTEASQRRLFLERQFEQVRDKLAKAEAVAKEALEKGGLVQVESQGRAIVEATASLRGKITVKEVQIGAMRTFATERNPELQLARKELESLKHELARIEGPSAAKSENAQVSRGSGIETLGLLRDVKYYETVYDLLAKQYELAKIDEAKDSAIVQVIDKAIEPDEKSKPRRSVFVLLYAFAALFVGIVWAVVREGMARAKADPKQASRLLDLKRHLAWK